jgi:hypothetical protein
VSAADASVCATPLTYGNTIMSTRRFGLVSQECRSRHSVILGESGGSQSSWLEGKTPDKYEWHVLQRELRVGGKLIGVDGNGVCVALYTDIVRSGRKTAAMELILPIEPGCGLAEPLS